MSRLYPSRAMVVCFLLGLVILGFLPPRTALALDDVSVRLPVEFRSWTLEEADGSPRRPELEAKRRRRVEASSTGGMSLGIDHSRLSPGVVPSFKERTVVDLVADPMPRCPASPADLVVRSIGTSVSGVEPSWRRPSSRSTCRTQVRIAPAEGSNSLVRDSGLQEIAQELASLSERP